MSEYKYYIKKIYQPSPGLVILEVADKAGRPIFTFRPGQYAMISYKNSQGWTEDKHAFSIASSPTQNKSICFGIRVQGPFTQGLTRLKEGEELTVSGPYGDFFYDEKKYSDSVLIAGGIGITPFISILNYAADYNLKNKLFLIYSAKTFKGATFYEEIKNLEKSNLNISALFSFTEEQSISEDKKVLHRRIDTESLKNFIGNVHGKTFFICGPTLFMDAIIIGLLSLGVAKNQIKIEKFLMIPDQAIWSRLKNISYALGLAAVLFALVFNSINKSSITATPKKIYDPALISRINSAAFNRLISIYETKNKALIDLNKQILAAANSVTPPPVTVKQTTVNTPPAPIVTPTPISIPAAMPAPVPTTRVS